MSYFGHILTVRKSTPFLTESEKKMEKVILKKIISFSLVILLLGVLATGLSVSMNSPKAEAAKITTADADFIEEILITGDGTGRDGNVFDGARLKELYAKITGDKGATFEDVKKLAEKPAASTQASVGGMTTGINASDFYTNNKNAIIVKIGGMDWIATALTTDRSGDNVVLSLLRVDATDTDIDKCLWANWESQSMNSSMPHPAIEYSTSLARSVLLNGYTMTDGDGKDGNAIEVKYSQNSSGTLLSIDPNADYQYDVFTNASAADSITDFIVKPKNVAYQETQNLGAVLSYSTGPNDAYGTPYKAAFSSLVSHVTTVSTYTDWKYDYLWLPSYSEMGTSRTVGVWGMNAAERSSDVYTWTRTGAVNSNWRLSTYTASGVQDADYINRTKRGVRPAFHLNLTKAEDKSATVLEVPTMVSSIYNGSVQDLTNTKADWYNAAFANPSVMKVEYFDKDGVKSAVPRVAGTYTVKCTIVDADRKTTWASGSATDFMRSCKFVISPKPIQVSLDLDSGGLPTASATDMSDICDIDKPLPSDFFGFRYNSTGATPSYNDVVLPTSVGTYEATATISNPNYTTKDTYKIPFSINVRRVKMPTFMSGDSQVYNGTDRSFVLQYDTDEIKISVPDRFVGKYTITGNSFVRAKRAGEYAVKVELINPDETLWEDQPNNRERELKFTINPAQIVIDIIPDGGTPNKISVGYGEKKKVSVDVIQKPIVGDTSNIDIIAKLGTIEFPVFTGLTIDENSSILNCELATDALPEGSWEFKALSDNSDYTVVIDNSQLLLEVVPPSTGSALSWRVMQSGMVIDRVNAELEDVDITYSKKIAYDGKTYTIVAREPRGYRIDTSYNDNGFVRGYKDASGSDAGQYVTYVRLLDENLNPVEYIFRWEIVKAKFDLSDVKWLYDGKLPYSKDGTKITLDPKTMPDGLIAQYSGSDTGMSVKDSGTVSVKFSLDEAFKNNYELPVENDADSYEYDGDGDFEWSKQWIVEPAVIKMSWELKDLTDANGKIYRAQVLTDGIAEEVIEYTYYETDSNGKILDPNAPLKSIAVVDKEVKYYKALPSIKSGFAGNYVLETLSDPDKYYSGFFAVGNQLTQVQIQAEGLELEYKGKPIDLRIKVLTGSLPSSAFEIKYFDGYTALSGAPVEVGKYRAQVSLKNSYMGTHYISGDYTFEIEIVKSKINVDWNKQTLPYALNLKYGQINGVSYEFTDTDGNPMTFVNLKAGETYKVRAVIKDSQLKNYIFADGTMVTAWEEFTATDNMIDPNDPTHPIYPTTDPDDKDPDDPVDPGKPDDDKKGGLSFDSVSEFLRDWWQVIASGISIVLIVVFLAKTASYENRRKKAVKKGEKFTTGVYAATGLFGLTMTSWTVIASCLMVAAVASFVIMLIAKSRCIKAEETLEESKEEYNNNLLEKKKEEENMRREDEMRRRDEEMKMMFMHMMGGAGANMGSGGARIQCRAA